MRNVLVLACLGAWGVTSLAAGDTPPAPSPPSTTSTASEPAAKTPATPAAAQTPASAKTSATAPAVDPFVQNLLSQGYTQQLRHGQMLYCKREPVMGSRVEKIERCGTPEELKATTQLSRDATENSQRIQIPLTGH